MGTTSGRDTSIIRGRPRHSAGPHIHQRRPGHTRPRPNQLRQNNIHHSSRRNLILPRPWMRQEARREDREVLPLVAAFKRYRGRVDFFAIPAGHAGTTLTRTLDRLTAAFSTVRPRADQASAGIGTSQTITDSNAISHDYRLFKSLLAALTDLTYSRLLCIIKNRKRLVEALPGVVSRN